MSRIAPVEPPYAAPVAETLAKWMPAAGAPPLALFRTLVLHPRLSDRMRPLGAALLGSQVIAPRDRELVILRTCARVGAEYEWGVHVTAFSSAVGLTGREVAATCAPLATHAWSDSDAQLIRLADELHDSGTVSDALWSALAAGRGAPELLELVTLVGFYHLISFVANAAAVDHEPWAARFPAERSFAPAISPSAA
ncbi:MAG: carboxymuconolactone decarboxylase [Myxococcales bacterium]|nr:carboxymuconolactone decarboxylase [Myxococcales bacterium]